MLLSQPPSIDAEASAELDPQSFGVSSTDSVMPGPTETEIAVEAYARYVRRGCEDGHAIEDWLQAERALRERSTTDAA